MPTIVGRPGGPYLFGETDGGGLDVFVNAGDVDGLVFVGWGLEVGALEVEDDALDAGAEADARRRTAAELLDQAVVAAAAAERALLSPRPSGWNSKAVRV